MCSRGKKVRREHFASKLASYELASMINYLDVKGTLKPL